MRRGARLMVHERGHALAEGVSSSTLHTKWVIRMSVHWFIRYPAVGCKIRPLAYAHPFRRSMAVTVNFAALTALTLALPLCSIRYIFCVGNSCFALTGLRAGCAWRQRKIRRNRQQRELSWGSGQLPRGGRTKPGAPESQHPSTAQPQLLLGHIPSILALFSLQFQHRAR